VVLAVVHLGLWWRSLPLAYQDLSFYFEPAILLANEGWLAGPASHYHDLTYVRGMYFYPPGFPLVLAGWIRAFGSGAGSLLAYTNVVHLFYLLGLWALLRLRLRCTRAAAALALLSAFPMFNHGRADLTALLFGVAAWLLLPRHLRVARIMAAGLLLGLAVLVSPPFGISSAAAVGVYLLASLGEEGRRRILGFGLLAAIAVLTFVGIWATVLTWQGAWEYGIEQFAVNSRVRAAELNHFPAVSPYLIVFGVVPLGILTLVPVGIALLPRWRRTDPRLWRTGLAYLGGFVAWFVLSKAPLLTGAHHGYLGRPVFHAALGSARGLVGRLGLVVMLAFSVVHWYLQKDNLLALAQGYTGFEEAAREITVPPEAIIGLDSDVFPYLYRPGRSINYELMGDDYWRRTRAETSPATLAALGMTGCRAPVVPDMLVISARTVMVFGPPDSTLFVSADSRRPQVELAHVLGRSVRFPRYPSTVYHFVRRPGVPRSSDAQCSLLPATPKGRETAVPVAP